MHSNLGTLKTLDEVSFTKLLKKKQKKVLRLKNIVALKGQEVDMLMEKQLKDRNTYRCSRKLSTWRNTYEAMKSTDRRLRPSDQNASLRTYQRMDRDLWERDELRGWFDKYSTPFDPSPPPTGYLVQVRSIRQEASETSRSRPSTVPSLQGSRLSSPKRSSRLRPLDHTEMTASNGYAWAVPPSSGPGGRVLRSSDPARRGTPAGVVPGVWRPQPRAHFLDYQGNLAAQQEKNKLDRETMMASGGYKLKPPFKERPLEEEGFFVPNDVLAQRDHGLLRGRGLEDYQSNRQEAKQRIVDMRAGHIFG